MSHRPASATALRVSELSQNAPTPFALRPDAPERAKLAQELELLGLKKLSFEGAIAPSGKTDWRLSGRLGATVVQPCAVTLAPVTTRIDEDIARLYMRDYVEVDALEVEIPEDDSTERLSALIDPAAVMREALILSLPLYPRADDAALGEVVVTEPGLEPMRDEDARPFAGLASLRDQMTGGRSDDKE